VFKHKIVQFLAYIIHVVDIKHNNRKENTNQRRCSPEDVVDDISTDVCRHSGCPNCAGSEDVMRDRRCAHLAPSVMPLEPRASCVAVATRTSRAPLARRPWKCRCLGVPGTPPLARTRALPSLAL
jgi:hypothetical protein